MFSLFYTNFYFLEIKKNSTANTIHSKYYYENNQIQYAAKGLQQ